MSSYLRKYKRLELKKENDNIKQTYNKKPKEKCPLCGKKTLFYKNKDNEVYCIRCDKMIKTTH